MKDAVSGGVHCAQSSSRAMRQRVQVGAHLEIFAMVAGGLSVLGQGQGSQVLDRVLREGWGTESGRVIWCSPLMSEH